MRREGWGRCLFALLLATSLAGGSSDLNDDFGSLPEDSRSGRKEDDDDNIDFTNEYKSENNKAIDDPHSSNINVPAYPNDDENRRRIHEVVDWIDDTDPIYKIENPDGSMFPEPSAYPSGYGVPFPKDDVNDGQMPHHLGGYENPQEGMNGVGVPQQDNLSDFLVKDQVIQPGAEPVHEELALGKDPTYGSPVPDKELPYGSQNPLSLEMDKPFGHQQFFSQVIPLHEHVLLHDIPGTQNLLQCSREGEMHHFWGAGLQCMVCVCLPAGGRLRPVCVSCQACMDGPKPHTTVAPVTPPPTPPPPPEDVSCDPLPVNTPFPSPLDPCKICYCTETRDLRGKLDVKIRCRHNPQCVLPTTAPPLISTPVPLPACDKFPPNVPFPHPHDACQTCQCVVRRTPYGDQRDIVCYPNAECQPTTNTPLPGPDVTELPSPDICDRYPHNALFPHPRDRCQLCKCIVREGLFYEKKKITCFVRPECRPDKETTPEPVTVVPEPECEGRPENVKFVHPTDPCRVCQCARDYNSFIPMVKMSCYLAPACLTTQKPVPTTPVPWTPPPQPENVRCAPLPTGRPFQSPINPCQICMCTETADMFGKISVEIECRENEQCVIQHNTTTLPPEVITGIPLPACRHYPENVVFPHPSDPCKLCKCHTQINGRGVPEQQINCYTRPECLPTPPSPTTRKPEPEDLCDRYPVGVYFPFPSDPCKVCKCQRDPFTTRAQISCFLRPECEPTPEPPPQPDDTSCAPLPTGVEVAHPLHPCQLCVCSERPGPLGGTQVLIECRENPQCVLPPDHSTLSPDIMNKTIVPACKNFPENVYFPHPSDSCQLCKCNTVPGAAHGPPEQVMSCVVRRECLPPPPTEQPDPYDVCDRYPVNTPFDDPYDQCRTCRCLHAGSSDPGDGLQNSFLPPKYRMICYTKPECVPQPTTPQPVPDEICEGYPVDTPFDDPNDRCRICHCTQTGGAAPSAVIQNAFPTKYQIVCHIKRECLQPSTTELPIPHDVCERYPVDTPFQDPNDECQICKCIEIGNASPGTGLQNSLLPPQYQMICYTKNECLQPTTSEHPIPSGVCERYPVETPFQDPNDECRICKCTEIGSAAPGAGLRNSYIPPKYTIMCYTKPECLQPSSTELPVPQDVRICERYPLNTPFVDPKDECRICKCTLIGSEAPGADLQSSYYSPKYQIMCHIKRACLPPSTTTERPAPYDICERYPVDTPFQDPNDECRICKCTLIGSAAPAPGASLRNSLFPPKYQILCTTKRECLPTTTIEPPVPYDVCANYPIDTPFDDPNDECRMCRCTYTHSGSAQPGSGLQNPLFPSRPPPQLQILCYIKPECMTTPPPVPTTDYPPPDEVCGRYPVGIPFDDPRDPCRVCACAPAGAALGSSPPRYQITCRVKHSCLPPSTVEPPVPYDVCASYPLDTPFEDPNDECRTCTCTYAHSGSAAPGSGLQSALFPTRPPPQLQILCTIKPECLPTHPPEPTEEPTTSRPPSPSDVCGRYPANVPFDDPNDECSTCVCSYMIGSAAPAPGVQQTELFPPKFAIQCHIKPECLPTEEPEPQSVCDYHAVDVPFDDPRDPCRSCTCHWSTAGSAPAGPGHALPVKLYKCDLKPECLPTSPPVTDEPDPYSFCENYPVDVPFTDPRDPCRSCECYWGAAAAGAGAPPAGPGALAHSAPVSVKLFRCYLKSECYRPTSEPITKSPAPDVSCKPLPSGVPFQSPLNPCQVCTCTETVDIYGRPDVVFKCYTNPQCVVPTDVTTVPPDSHTSPVPLPACAQFPTNVVFPHPSDPCKLCKCTVQITSWGQQEQLINCFPNPDCAVTTTTPAPWPPAPPGPLPGPAPHESCAPYVPNQPFQHPWDECQVCVCREAVTTDRITIEVNCYTKPSCCYEPPFDLSGSGSQDGILQINGGGSSWVTPATGSLNYNWQYPNENIIGQAGSNIIGSTGGNIIRPTGGNGIYTAGGSVIGSSSDTLYGQSGAQSDSGGLEIEGEIKIGYKGNKLRQLGNIMGSSGSNSIGPTGGNEIGPSGGNSIGAISDNWIKSTGTNMIGPTGANVIKNTGGNMIGQTGANVIGSTGSNVIGPTGGNMIGPTGGNVIGSAGGNMIGLNGANGFYRPNNGVFYRPPSTTFGTNIHPYLNSNGNMYVANRGSLVPTPIGSTAGSGLWKKSYHYNLKPEIAVGAETGASFGFGSNAAIPLTKPRYSEKMRTKSGRPSDNDSEDYD